MFALTPNPETDTDFPNVMKAVDFKKDPSRLFAIFTTPENTPKVKKWINEAGLDSDKVYTFEGFWKQFKRNLKRQSLEKLKNLIVFKIYLIILELKKYRKLHQIAGQVV